MKALDPLPLPLDVVLRAYAQGYFPMGDGYGNDEMNWYNPPQRAVLPLGDLHISRKLRRLALTSPYEIRIDTAFEAVIEGCTENRLYQWITRDIRNIFNALHKAGLAHSVECWSENRLVGGIYGLALGSAFCAESMFNRAPEASKIALLHLCARLAKGGFTLLDCQIWNEHTGQFGAYDIPKNEYLARLDRAICTPADFALEGFTQAVTEAELIAGFCAKS